MATRDLQWCLVAWLCCIQAGGVESFSLPVSGGSGPSSNPPAAVLLRSQYISDQEEHELLHTLREVAGYSEVSTSEQLPPSSAEQYCYEFSRAVGMLKLVSSPVAGAADRSGEAFDAPRWVPVVRGEENVLVANGWSFLDPDESEPMSAFDIDAANMEGQYRPKWGEDGLISASENTASPVLSSLGYDISPMSKDDILAEANLLTKNEYSRGVLLAGNTDPSGAKTTYNGYDFRGSADQQDIPAGIFVTAIGGLPLFASTDLAPTTGSSGWLSFSRSIVPSHVQLIEPDKDSMDRRVEVVCARSRLHLGHYFGPGEGYCINASALRFIPAEHRNDDISSVLPLASRPISWRPLDSHRDPTPSQKLLITLLERQCRFEEVALGCGCFWHVEYALRRLPGIYTTQACYAGGDTALPTYRGVCGGKTGHAEVVWILYDPEVCPSNTLFDCFLAMHDPTKVRAHGKHAQYTGQYRSCIFVTNAATERVAQDCLERCAEQLTKELTTDIRLMEPDMGKVGKRWCWAAEERHQRHDEILKGREKGTNGDSLSTLSAVQWLTEYGRRRPTIFGSSETIPVGMDPPDDDGMARMMI